MNKRKTHTLVLAILIGLPQLSFGQAAANCDVVTKAAQAGRDHANNTLANNQLKLKEAAQFHRNCLEIFGDLASLQIMVIGGFDISPLRDMLLDKACSIIKDDVVAALPMTNVPPPWNGVVEQTYQPSQPGGNSGGSGDGGFNIGGGSSPINIGSGPGQGSGGGSMPSMPPMPSMPSMARSASSSSTKSNPSGSSSSPGSVWDRLSCMVSGKC